MESAAVTVYVTGFVKSCIESDAGEMLEPVWVIEGISDVRGVEYGTVSVIARVASSMVPAADGIANENPVMVLAPLLGVSEEGRAQAEKNSMPKKGMVMHKRKAAMPNWNLSLCFLIFNIIT